MIKNIYEMLRQVCEENKDRIFFVRQRETYADLLRKVKRRALVLAKRFQIKKGDTIAILSGNTPEFINTYFASAAIGAKLLMLDTGLSPQEHINMMEKTDCKLAITQHKYKPENGIETFDIETEDTEDEAEFVASDVNLDDIAMLSFTSGSTGNPKVVGLTHNNIVSLGEGALFYSPVILPGYMFYGFLPLYHIYGVVINIIAPIVLRGSLLLQPILKPTEFLKDFKEYQPQVIPAVPRIWEVFYKKITDGLKEKKVYWLTKIVVPMRKVLKSIGLGFIYNKISGQIHEIFGGKCKVLVSAGATLKPSIRKFYEGLGFAVGDCYGLTETTGPSNFNFAFRQPNGKMYYAGPLPGNEIKFINVDADGVGEIMVRGNMVMPGYIDNDVANDESFVDGWFKTGDLGLLDKKNRLVIKGRKKQVIVLDNGKNVYPDELEDLYLHIDGVVGVSVIEHTIDGKIVPLAVFQVEKDVTDASKISLAMKAANLTIAPYKWARHFAITTDELPRTSAGKIRAFMVRDMVKDGQFKILKS